MFKIFTDKNKIIIGAAVLWQIISIGLVATGVWPQQISLFNLGLLVVLFVILPAIDALGLFLLSLPFMVVLPNFAALTGLPMWRILVAWLFVVIATKYLFARYQQSRSGFKLSNFISKEIKYFWQEKLQSWDKWLLGLLLLGGLSLFAARFPVHGIKQLIFLINVYLLYLACILVVDSQAIYKALLYYIKLSLLITVLLGFVQYILSLFFSPFYFWQYWASLISSSYYGQALGDVLAYSNSWFSANGGGQSLRMFGILQDTHAFSVVVIFALAFWLVRKRSWQFWLGLTGLCFALIASGTRGAWLAMLAPAVITVFIWLRYKAKALAMWPLVAHALVIVLFMLSPFISIGLNWVRTINSDDNFLDRATSIYDLNESSNVGRLEIWKSSVVYAIHHPLGTGYGNFISSISSSANSSGSGDAVTYEQLSQQKNLRFNLPQKFITAHSLYLHVLVELGLIGLLLFGLMWLSFFAKIWHYLKSEHWQVNQKSLLLFNIGLASVWLLAYGLFDVTILNERVLLYLMAIIAIVNLVLRNKELNSN